MLTCTLFPRVFSFVDNCVFPCGRVLLMSGWICQWKPFWIPVGNTFQKAHLEEWLRVEADSPSDPGENSCKAVPMAADSMTVRGSENKDCTVKHKQPLDAPSAPRSSWQAVGKPHVPTLELLGSRGTATF